MSLKQYQQDIEIQTQLQKSIGKLIVIVFYAEWNKPSLYFKDKFTKTIPLFGQFDNVQYLFSKAENNPKIFKQFSIEYTPTVIFVDSFENIIKKYEEQDIGLIFDELAIQSENFRIHFQKQKRIWIRNIQNQLNQIDTVLLMKGNLQNIQKYQNVQFVNFLNQKQINYTFINIFEKYRFAQWVRFQHKFQDYPQLFVRGKLIGSYSLCRQLHQKSQFLTKIPRESFKKSPKNIFQELLKHNYIVFVDDFSFQRKQAHDQLPKLAEKYQNLVIYNTSLCLGLKQIIIEKTNKTLPTLYVDGKHLQILI